MNYTKPTDVTVVQYFPADSDLEDIVIFLLQGDYTELNGLIITGITEDDKDNVYSLAAFLSKVGGIVGKYRIRANQSFGMQSVYTFDDVCQQILSGSLSLNELEVLLEEQEVTDVMAQSASYFLARGKGFVVSTLGDAIPRLQGINKIHYAQIAAYK